MILFKEKAKYQEFKFDYEKDYEKEIFENSKTIFGEHTICISTKKKIDSKSLGGTIPDGFLFDMTDKDNLEFYLIEIELYKHDFSSHILPQLTKFFAFFNNTVSQSELANKIFSLVNNDNKLKDEFKKYIGDREIYKTIKDSIENSQNILLLIDDVIEELPEIMDIYFETWGKMIKLMLIKKFISKDDFMYFVDPEFENVEVSIEKSVEKFEKNKDNEEFHLKNINDDMKNNYLKIKKLLLEYDSNLIFNSKRYYISIRTKLNYAFIKFRKNYLEILIMLPEETIKNNIKNYFIKHLSDSLQRYHSKPCASVLIDSEKDITEIVDLIILSITTNSKSNQN